MFASENAAESRRFLESVAAGLKAGAGDFDPHVVITICADIVEALLQRWPALGLESPEVPYLPPLSSTACRDEIQKPAQVYAERVERLAIEPALVSRLDARTEQQLQNFQGGVKIARRFTQ